LLFRRHATARRCWKQNPNRTQAIIYSNCCSDDMQLLADAESKIPIERKQLSTPIAVPTTCNCSQMLKAKSQ
jgi:hypothetical protein